MAVDNESDNTRILKIAWEDSGFEVDEFNKSTVALCAFEPRQYDLIIFNINLSSRADDGDELIGNNVDSNRLFQSKL